MPAPVASSPPASIEVPPVQAGAGGQKLQRPGRILRGAALAAEPVLAAWGITASSKPMFVGQGPGSGESTDAWADFLTDLRQRGLTCPLLIVSDGARGLIAVIEQFFPQALRQRCLIHRLRNILAKIPTGVQAEVRDG